ncbi:MAG: CapA family protein [Clostridia bacterium]|nr:CapA family protein [Clostridia bacterium]
MCIAMGIFAAFLQHRAAPVLIETTMPPQPVMGEIVLSFAGDCTLGSDPRFSYAGSFHEKYKEKDSGYFFSNVQEIFAADTLTFVNLEGTFTEAEKAADKTYVFRGPAEYADILTAGSVEAVSIANNHTYDFLEDGFKDTKDTLQKEGIAYAAGKKTALFAISVDAAGVATAREIQPGTQTEGIKIGFCAFQIWYDDQEVRENLKTAVKSLREAGADIVLVSCHWGIEREKEPYSVQKDIGRYAIDVGADGVLGHHPHVIQGIEQYKGKEIVYSMGNFCFGGNHNPADQDCYIYQLKYATKDGALTGAWERNIIPCKISSTPDKNDYCPTPAEGAEAERIRKRISIYAE